MQDKEHGIIHSEKNVFKIMHVNNALQKLIEGRM
jgi:hypothetical protein